MNELFALKISWNLNILRDTLRRGGQPNLVFLSPAGVFQLMHPRSQGTRFEAQDRCGVVPVFQLKSSMFHQNNRLWILGGRKS